MWHDGLNFFHLHPKKALKELRGHELSIFHPLSYPLKLQPNGKIRKWTAAFEERQAFWKLRIINNAFKTSQQETSSEKASQDHSGHATGKSTDRWG